ncbi:hypothetical protein KGM_210190 [Danaus plexippus plexippus]|uniref:Uncharacterized protein n=2 Tax=Danaus plexippus plexippus TaxID=278856 RepID=A0A212F0B2_DANPL|nr:hypothetical protein KGM_210190 [Danaus plexippus plexippus]
MMDLKEIIKWFIPCFHLLLNDRSFKMDVPLTVFCLLLLFAYPSSAAKLYSDNEVSSVDSNLSNFTKNIDEINNGGLKTEQNANEIVEKSDGLLDFSIGRTFGRPFKKMLQAMIPLAFGLGSAATWAVVAALVGIKTLAVTLIILKLLLMAGAAKFGAFFASKSHSTHDWSPQQKEIHLHIHNGHSEEHVPVSPWNREGVQNTAESKHVNVVYEPYSGPQTISTPYGHYMRIDPGYQIPQ